MHSEMRELQELTRNLAAHCNPAAMTLTELDRLHDSIDRAMKNEPAAIDLFTLDELVERINRHRCHRQLAQQGHVAGQLDLYGNELAA